VRVQIHIDSANTKQVRELLAALAGIGKHESATVGLNGPEHWTATTPYLTPQEHAELVARLVRFNGVTLEQLIKEAS